MTEKLIGIKWYFELFNRNSASIEYKLKMLITTVGLESQLAPWSTMAQLFRIGSDPIVVVISNVKNSDRDSRLCR